MAARSVKSLINTRKKVCKDTDWQHGRIRPAYHGRLWEQSLEMPPFWTWRSLVLDDGALICLFRVYEGAAKFQAMLIELGDGTRGRLISRCEYYPGKDAGLHVHTHCPEMPEEDGPRTIDAPFRIPEHGARHRRNAMIYKDDFFVLACGIFHIESEEARQLVLLVNT